MDLIITTIASWKDNIPNSKAEKIDLTGIFTWIYMIMGALAVIFLVYGAIQYIISRGDPGKMAQAKTTMIYAVVGLIIVILAATITLLVFNALNGTIGTGS